MSVFFHTKKASALDALGLAGSGSKLLTTAKRLPKTFLNQGKRVGQHFSELAQNPVSGMKKAWNAGGTQNDPIKRKKMLAELLDDGLDGDINKFKTMDKGGKGPVNWLRQQGILSAGKSTKGRMSPEQKAEFVKKMRAKGLVYDNKGVGTSVISNQKKSLSELQAGVDEMYKIKAAQKGGTFMQNAGSKALSVMPGERGMWMAPAAAGALNQGRQTHNKDGTKRSAGERIGRAAVFGAMSTAAAPLDISDKFGLMGAAASNVGTEGVFDAMDKFRGKRRGKAQAAMAQQQAVSTAQATADDSIKSMNLPPTPTT